MAAEVLESCFVICQFFYEQKKLNDEAKGLLADLADYVARLVPGLESLDRSDRRGLEMATAQLTHLWACLRECQRIYVKYKDGWKLRKFHVTPKQILDKAKTQEERLRHAWQDLATFLSIAIHKNMQPSAPTVTDTMTDDTWEMDANSVQIDFEPGSHGVPITVLGQGSFGVVGLGTLTRGDGTVEKVAVKMAMPNTLVAAKKDPQHVADFRSVVRIMGAVEHPNIVRCYGGITYQGRAHKMWIVMEVLDFTLLDAINRRHLKIGRDDPQTYVNLVSGIISALTYLHTPVNGNPIVHRDLKPENIMINNLEDQVVKLIDLDMAKKTAAGVGSTFSIKGTREYMAPEQQSGGCSVASDMWSAALVALFIWSGKTLARKKAR